MLLGPQRWHQAFSAREALAGQFLTAHSRSSGVQGRFAERLEKKLY